MAAIGWIAHPACPGSASEIKDLNSTGSEKRWLERTANELLSALCATSTHEQMMVKGSFFWGGGGLGHEGGE